MSLGGNSKVKNHSVATGFDYTLNPTTVLDFRFGFYQYKVDVLPFDFGTHARDRRGHPGPQLRRTFTSGLSGHLHQRRPRLQHGLGPGREPLQLPAGPGREAVAGGLEPHQGPRQPHREVRLRHPPGLQPPRPQRRPPLGRAATSAPNRTIGPNGGGLGPRHLPARRRDLLRALSSARARTRGSGSGATSTTCRTPGAPTPKLTLNYGLRADIYNPQTVNEAGNGGWLDINTGEIRVGGVGDIDLAGNVKNKVNWAPRLGVAYQINEKTVIRAGYGRSYDTGVFGSIFGHAVTQNLPVLSVQQLNAPNNFDSVFNLADGPSAPVFVTPGPNGRFTLPNGVSARLLPDKQNVPALDAWNVSVQRAAHEHALGRAGLRGQPQQPRLHRQRPGRQLQRADARGLRHLNTNQRRPFFSGPSGRAQRRLRRPRQLRALGWTQGIDYFCNCGKTDYQALQAKITRRFSNGWSLLAHYTFQKAKNNDGSYFFIDPNLNYGPNQFGRDHNFVVSRPWPSCPSARARSAPRTPAGVAQALIGGWQVNTNVYIQSGLPFDVGYAGSGSDRDTGPNRPDLIGDADRAEDAGPVVQRHAHRLARQRLRPSGHGDLRQHGAQLPDRPRLLATWTRRSSSGSAIGRQHQPGVPHGGRQPLQPRQPGQPDNTESAPRPTRGPTRAASRAPAAQNQMRNLQFALRFQF